MLRGLKLVVNNLDVFFKEIVNIVVDFYAFTLGMTEGVPSDGLNDRHGLFPQELHPLIDLTLHHKIGTSNKLFVS